MNSIGFADRDFGLPHSQSSALSAEQALSAISLFIDALFIVLASVLASVTFRFLADGGYGDIDVSIATGFITAVLFCSFLRLNGLRSRRADFTNVGRARTAALIWTLTFAFLIILAFGLKISSQFSRGTISLFYVFGLASVCTSRLAIPRLVTRWSLNNAQRGTEIIVVVPHGDNRASRLRTALTYQGCRSFRTIAFCDTFECETGFLSESKRVVQAVCDAARVAAPGPIYLLAGAVSPKVVLHLLKALRIIPRPIYLVPDEFVSALLPHDVRLIGRMSAVEVQRSPLNHAERLAKRCVDIVAASCGIFFCLPFLLSIALAIKLDSKGPVLFRQNRQGYRGQLFRILKFRTMTVMEDGDDIKQATRHDNRVTRLGSFLRGWSLDELPQLWNVLCGDMSLIGPRPHALAHDRLYSELIDNYEIRQHVRPGITGWAQIHGLRGETPNLDSMYRRIELDIWYARNCALLLDLQIIVRTVVEVLRRRNAY